MQYLIYNDAQGWAEEVKDKNDRIKYVIKFGTILETLREISSDLDEHLD